MLYFYFTNIYHGYFFSFFSLQLYPTRLELYSSFIEALSLIRLRRLTRAVMDPVASRLKIQSGATKNTGVSKKARLSSGGAVSTGNRNDLVHRLLKHVWLSYIKT